MMDEANHEIKEWSKILEEAQPSRNTLSVGKLVNGPNPNTIKAIHILSMQRIGSMFVRKNGGLDLVETLRYLFNDNAIRLLSDT